MLGEVDGRTRVAVHLAYPATHVRTPALLNRRCQARNLNLMLVPWQVALGDLASTIDALRAVENLAGMVVTVPHKAAAAAQCDELTGDAALLGVVNVIRRTADGRLIGAILDGEAFVAGLRNKGIEPAEKRIFLVGAGGAATAIAHALINAGAKALVVANRTPEKADTLVALIAGHRPDAALSVGPADPADFDIVVNGTSLGLHASDALPFDVSRIAPGAIVAEIVMQPAVTPLLEAARDRGLRIHEGEHMIHAQIDGLIDFLLE